RTAVRELRILKNEAKQDPKGIYEKIEGILNAYMSDGFSINIRGGGNIREELAGLGIDEAVADSLQMEIESFSFARFAPTRHHEGDIAGAFARVEKILRDLEKCREKAQKGKEGGAQSLPAILSVFAIISFPHFTISAAPGDGDDRRQGSIPEQSGINELFVDANRAYSNGDYETALKIYGKLSGDFRTETPALMFNTANVNFRTGRFGEAILLYKRVLKLSGDAGLSRAAKKNLDTVRETLSLLEEEKEGSVKYMATDYHDGTFLVFSVIPFDVSLFIALIAFTAFSLIFAVFRLRETPGGAIKSLAAALLVLSILCAVNLWGTAHVAANYRLGIVTEKDARVYDGKTLEAASIPAPEGLEVRILSEENGFYSIELTGGQNGYIP
ncbi:MAG: hypothetical protein FJ088_15645, partial [Deltaproteobacteria bacterium]|nr:hypothetical protein [Deltaproteobacteria bacterium]